MDRTKRFLALSFGMLLGWTLVGTVNLSGWRVQWIATVAAESLKVDGLPDEPRQFRASVDSIIKKVDALIEQLRGKPTSQAILLDLLQTRDDIIRELPKLDGAPGDAKWNQKEMRESVQGKLMLLRNQYEKAQASAG
jgi:hypothetical protein